MEKATGFETGTYGETDGGDGSPTVVAGGHCGDYQLECQGSVVNRYLQFTGVTPVFFRSYISIDREPTNGETVRVVQFFDVNNSDTALYLKFEKSSGGQKRLNLVEFYPSTRCNYYNFNWQINTKYCIEIKFYEHSSSGEYRLRINDNEVITRTGLNTNMTSAVDRVYFGIREKTGSWNPRVHVDCVVVSDSGWIGSHEPDFDADAETGDFSPFDSVVDNPLVQAVMYHCGVYGYQLSVAGGESEGAVINVGHHKEGKFQIYVRFPAMPASGDYIEFFLITRDTTSIMTLRVRNNGGTMEWGFGYRHASSFSYVYDPDTKNPSADTWYCVDVELVLSPVDGTATADYTMSIREDGGTLAELNDCTITNVDSDYTGFTDLKMLASTDGTSAIVYEDCMLFQTTALPACHDAEYEAPPPPPIPASESLCTPRLEDGVGEYQVWHNCKQIPEFEEFQGASETRGIASIWVPDTTNIVKKDTLHAYGRGNLLVQGRAVAISRDIIASRREVLVQTESTRVYGRVIRYSTHQTYSGWDVGAIAKDLIDYYFDGLFTSDGIDTNVGITVSDIDLNEMTVGDALDKLCIRGNCAWYVENYIVHFFALGSRSSNIVLDADNIAGNPIIEDVGEPIGTVLVFGDGVTGVAGSGLPEVPVSDRRITSAEEAQEVAEAYLAYFSNLIHMTLPSKGFYHPHRGETLIVNLPDKGYKNEVVTINRVAWSVKAGQITTTFSTGVDPPNFDYLVSETERVIREQKINRISQHMGSEGGEGDPTALFTEIGYASASSISLGSGGDQLIVSETCDSEPDAAHIVEVIVTITGWSSANYCRCIIYLTDGSNTLESRYVVFDNSSGYTNYEYILQKVFLEDFSGKTISCRSDTMGGDTATLTKAEITINQYLMHGHSEIQTQDHDFD
jgi:hypothetical protein